MAPARTSLLLLLLLPLLSSAQVGPPSPPQPRLSPEYLDEFSVPLPIPPTKTPIATYTNPETGVPIDFFEVDIKPGKVRYFPNLPETDIIGYDGIAPGPLFRVQKNRETLIRFINHGNLNASVHLHGSNTRSPWDGAPEAMIRPGEYRDYYYANSARPRTLWYHDHAAMLTTRNVFAGQKGVYIIEDPEKDIALGLPRGKYDVPLMLTAGTFQQNGQLFDTSQANQNTRIFGDTYLVNGQIMPYFEVEPRKYRFRVINAAAQRTFNLTLEGAESRLPLTVIASDGGLRSTPVDTESLVISMAERWEVIVDFSSFASQNITVRSANVLVDTNYIGVDKVMQFRVGPNVSSNDGNGPIPPVLSEYTLPTDLSTLETKTYNFGLIGGSDPKAGWVINGNKYDDMNTRVIAKPPLGTTERWILSGSPGWVHPIHAHLIDFVLISRSGGARASSSTRGRDFVEPYEVGALKDIATLVANEEVVVLAKFTPWPGVYSFHCHNLVHEDFAMMANFDVQALSDLGYNLTGFEDPVDPRFSAKQYLGATNLEDIQNTVLPYYSDLGAYPVPDEVQKKLDAYYSTKTGAPQTVTTSGQSSTPLSTPASASTSSTGISTTTSATTVSTPTTSTSGTVASSPAQTSSTTVPTSVPTGVPRPDNRCGPQFGNAPCSQSEPCCSQYGYCGNTENHCRVENNCRYGCWPEKVTTNGRCGKDFGGATCKGWVDGECCSQYGWCGRSTEHCGER